MEPRIQYAKTEDGVNIAYWTLGEGPPLVFLQAWPYEHCQLEWQLEDLRPTYESLASSRQLIRFDGRGSGLSDRHVTDFSLDARLLDTEAVVDRLGLGQFDLLGSQGSGAAAIAFTTRHPERISHLILADAYPRGAEYVQIPKLKALMGVLENDWELYTETLAQAAFGWSGASARKVAAHFRACTTPEVAKAVLSANAEVDVLELLPTVTVPTLIVQHSQLPFPSVEMARDLASRIPDAQLVIFDGDYSMDDEVQLRAFEDFLGGGKKTEPLPGALTSGTALILFLDIADSTALTTKLGDAAYREKERELDASLRAAITEAGGTPVEGKVLGDGVMAVFTSARQAIDAAQRCRDLGNDAGLPLHLGIHAGDVVREGNNVHGGAVQVASRVQGIAAPGEILVSATVRDLARTSADVAFEDHGEHELKGIPEPQRLFAVRA